MGFKHLPEVAETWHPFASSLQRGGLLVERVCGLSDAVHELESIHACTQHLDFGSQVCAPP